MRKSAVRTRGTAGPTRPATVAKATASERPGVPPAGSSATTARRSVLAALVAVSLPGAKARAEEEQAFLRRSGAKGLLVEEEERLIELRMTAEGNAKRLDAEVKQEIENAIERARAEGEAEAKKSFERTNSLCATPYGIDIVGITEGIALVGALVGGIAAKNRKDEVERLNDQLRTINVTLRKQARSGIVYAPDMNYAPVTGGPTVSEPKDEKREMGNEVGPQEAQQDEATASEAEPVGKRSEEAGQAEPAKKGLSELATALRSGRRLLEVNKGAAALVHFEKARMLSRAEGNMIQERRAERGLAAASRMQKQFKKAIGHLERVLEISKEMDEYTGDADAYGVIADIYTELGDLEKAAKYYDLYLKNIDLS